jgi:hypothetical protein
VTVLASSERRLLPAAVGHHGIDFRGLCFHPAERPVFELHRPFTLPPEWCVYPMEHSFLAGSEHRCLYARVLAELTDGVKLAYCTPVWIYAADDQRFFTTQVRADEG